MPQKKVLFVLACTLSAIFFVYLASFPIVFNLRETAFSWGEENYGNREVAIGPRPRVLFDRPTHWGTAYDPGQWSFRVYRPLCQIWLRWKGYAPPVQWRS